MRSHYRLTCLVSLAITLAQMMGCEVGTTAGRSDDFVTQKVSLATGALGAVWANDGGDKVSRDELRASASAGAVVNSVWDGQRVLMFGARNEVLAFNLVLEAPTTPASGVRVSFDTLVGPGGATIASIPATGDGVFSWVGRNIELFYVRYLDIRGLSKLSYEIYDERHVPKRFRRPFDANGVGSGTWASRPDHDKAYPEIAVPLELVPTFTVAAKQNQSIWVDIYVPKSATPGVYTGTITITENGTPTRQVPVELTVRGFTLPDEPTAKTMINFGEPDVNRRYTGVDYPVQGTTQDVTSKLVRDRHFQVAHRHKVSMIDADPGASAWSQDAPRPEWLPRLNGALFTGAKGYDGPGVGTGNNVYSIGTYGSWGWKGEGQSGMQTHTNAWANWFAASSPATETFLYLIDESSDYAQIEQWSQWINGNPGSGKSIRSFATIPLPDAALNTPSLDVPASWMTVGDTMSWENAATSFSSNPGKLAYMYNGKRPSQGSFATEDDGVALRQLAWAQYKKKIHRWYFWEACYYNNYQGGTGQTNVFQTARTFGADGGVDPVSGESGWNHSNGDGVLFYPGTDTVFPAESYGVKGPIASLRMKMWRRGIQDVDYLAMAAAIDPAKVAAIVGQMVPKALWEYGISDPADPTWVRADISWSTDPDVWEAARSQLAAIIDGAPPVVAPVTPPPAIVETPPTSTSQLTAVWANEGGDKVTRDELRATTDASAVLSSTWDGAAISQFGGRNETVSFNVVLEAPLGAKGVSVVFDRLTDPGGATLVTIPSKSAAAVFNYVNRPIELFYVRYLKVKGLSRTPWEPYDERHTPERLRRPFTGAGFGSGVWADRPDHDKEYPDIALPLEKKPVFDIAAGANQSIWVDVTIPKSADPGTYSGSLYVMEAGLTTWTIPVSVTVRGFTLPDVPTSKTQVHLGYADINTRYLGDAAPAAGSRAASVSRIVRDRHFQMAHRHRIALVDADPGSTTWTADQPRPEWRPRLDGRLFTPERGYSGAGMGVGNGVYSIGDPLDFAWKSLSASAVQAHADGWVTWFSKWSPQTEHFLTLPKDSDVASLATWAAWIDQSAGPGMNLMTLGQVSTPMLALSNAPALDIATSVLAVGDASAWPVAAGAYQASADKRIFLHDARRPAAGTFVIEDDGVALRELAWGQYKAGIDRWTYWASTQYTNPSTGAHTNVFKKAQTTGTVSGVDAVSGETGAGYANGDGVLFYPGKDTVYTSDSAGLLGPIASLRLKHWRRGIQDVDYLALAAAKDPVQTAAIVAQMVPKVLWENGLGDPDDPTWQRCDISWPTDPEVWEAARAQLATIIDGVK